MRPFIFLLCLITGLQVQAQLNAFSPGDIAPNFNGIEPDGTVHTLYDYTSSGKYVILDLFAYWCGPCISTAPKIQEFYEKYGCNSGNVVVLGNECDVGGSNEDLLDFQYLAGLDPETAYPSWSGMEGNGADVCNILEPLAYPTVVLIGPDNRFISIDIWPIANVGDLEEAFPAGVLVPKNCDLTNSIDSENTFIVRKVLYPNPADDACIVQLESAIAGDLQLLFVNSMGQLVMTKNFTGLAAGEVQVKMTTSGLNDGLYRILALFNGEAVFSEAIQIMHE